MRRAGSRGARDRKQPLLALPRGVRSALTNDALGERLVQELDLRDVGLGPADLGALARECRTVTEARLARLEGRAPRRAVTPTPLARIESASISSLDSASSGSGCGSSPRTAASTPRTTSRAASSLGAAAAAERRAVQSRRRAKQGRVNRLAKQAAAPFRELRLDGVDGVNADGRPLLSLFSLARHARAVTLTNAHSVPSEALGRALSRLTAVTELNVSGCSQLNDTDTMPLITALRRLVRLHVAGTAVSDLALSTVAKRPARTHARLARLDVSRCRHVSDGGIASLPAMTALDVSSCKGVTDVGIRALRGRELSTLNVAGTAITDSGLAAPAIGPALTAIDCSRCVALTDDGVTALAAQCPRLTRFAAVDSTAIGSAGVAILLARCPRLRDLDLRGCCSVGDDAFAAPQPAAAHPLRSLRSLRLDGLSRVSDAALRHLAARTAPALRELTLAGRRSGAGGFSAPRVSGQSIVVLLRRGTPLRSLSVRDTVAADDESVPALLDAAPTLRELDVAGSRGLLGPGLVTAAAAATAAVAALDREVAALADAAEEKRRELEEAAEAALAARRKGPGGPFDEIKALVAARRTGEQRRLRIAAEAEASGMALDDRGVPLPLSRVLRERRAWQDAQRSRRRAARGVSRRSRRVHTEQGKAEKEVREDDAESDNEEEEGVKEEEEERTEDWQTALETDFPGLPRRLRPTGRAYYALRRDLTRLRRHTPHSLARLQRLDVSRCAGLSDTALAQAVAAAPCLAALNASHCLHVSAATCSALAASPALHEAALDGTSAEAGAVRRLVATAPALRALSFRDTPAALAEPSPLAALQASPAEGGTRVTGPATSRPLPLAARASTARAAEMEDAATRLQRSIRSLRMRRALQSQAVERARAMLAEQEEASLSIQCWYRRRLARRHTAWAALGRAARTIAAAVAVQRAARGWLGRNAARSRRAAVHFWWRKILAAMRAGCAASLRERRHAAATDVQCAWRRWQARRVAAWRRLARAARAARRRRAATDLQRRWQGVLGRRACRRHCDRLLVAWCRQAGAAARTIAAAVTVQRAARGMLGRHAARARRAAATRLAVAAQRAGRGWQGRQRAKAQQWRREVAARSIQSAWRGRIGRRAARAWVLELTPPLPLPPVLTATAAGHRRYSDQHHQQLQEQLLRPVAFDAAFARRVGRARRAHTDAAVRLQSWWRCVHLRHCHLTRVERAREAKRARESAAVVVQGAWRCVCALRVLQARRARHAAAVRAASAIQRAWRSHAARAALRVRRREALRERTTQLLESSDRLAIGLRHGAALRVQRSWRAHAARIALARRREAAAVVVQRVVRGHAARRWFRGCMASRHGAASLLQSVWRGQLLRGRWRRVTMGTRVLRGAEARRARLSAAVSAQLSTARSQREAKRAHAAQLMAAAMRAHAAKRAEASRALRAREKVEEEAEEARAWQVYKETTRWAQVRAAAKGETEGPGTMAMAEARVARDEVDLSIRKRRLTQDLRALERERAALRRGMAADAAEEARVRRDYTQRLPRDLRHLRAGLAAAIEEEAWLREQQDRMERLLYARRRELGRAVHQLQEAVRLCGVVTGQDIRAAATAFKGGSRLWWTDQQQVLGSELQHALTGAAEDRP